MEDLSRINLKFLVGSIKDAYSQHPKRDQLLRVRIIVFMANMNDAIIEECRKLDILCTLSPTNAAELRQLMMLSDQQSKVQ